jgi:hypothetical protein
MILARGFFCSSSDAHQLYHTLQIVKDAATDPPGQTHLAGIKFNAPANSRLLRFPGSISSVHQMFVTQQGALNFSRLGHFDQRELASRWSTPLRFPEDEKVTKNPTRLNKFKYNLKII